MSLHKLPPVHEILSRPDVEEVAGRIVAPARTRLVRGVVAEFRKTLRRDPNAFPDRDAVRKAVAESVVARASELLTPFPRRVVNGTGILIHTNLGRAPLGPMLDGQDALTGYSNLEWNPVTGKRGSRDARVGDLLELLTGAEAAIVVNNCASALLLTLRELASDKKVIVSRSELVEIGGGFRVPEIIVSSGCRLVEVGTTNKTRLSDYRKKAHRGDCVLLKVHQSNFVQKGFVEDVPLASLAELAGKLRVPLVYDNGSGLPDALGLPFLSTEPTIGQGLRDGASIVVASGDKLLGSVQAGLVLGKAASVKAMRKNPLSRALRLDKVRLNLLHQALLAWLTGGEAGLPLWRMASRDVESLAEDKARLRLPDSKTRWKSLDWVDLNGSMGGGSNPEMTFPSLGLKLVHKDHTALEVRSHFADRGVPIVGYVQKGAFFLDIRTLLDADFPEVQQALDALA